MSKKKQVEIDIEEKDERCTCGEGAIEEHTCPFAEEINDDSESLCTCCDYCTHQCAMDI